MSKLPKTWLTKDGRTIKIRDMGSSHLVNTIKMLKQSVAEVAHAEFSKPIKAGSDTKRRMIQAMEKELDSRSSPMLRLLRPYNDEPGPTWEAYKALRTLSRWSKQP